METLDRDQRTDKACGPSRLRLAIVITIDSEEQDRFEPADIIVKRDEGVTITFADGHVGTYPMVQLRLGCPCATCRNLRELGEESWPRPGSPQPLRITDARKHGAWGLNITWNDGHATGIFPFESLRHWSESRSGG